MYYKKTLLLFILFSVIVFSLPMTGDVHADVSSVTYKGTLNGKRMHIYKFSTTTSGTLNIDDTGTAATIGFYLREADNPQSNYIPGDTLPVGTYKFIVFSNEDISANYSYVISGVTLAGTPDTTLPSLTITKPSSYDFRIPKGYSTLNGEGTSNGITTVSINENTYSIPTGSFTKYMSFRYGRNDVEFVTTNSSGNAVMDPFTVTVPGMKRITGASPSEVAANISIETDTTFYKDEQHTVIIARSDAYGDVLGSVPLSVKDKAPILYTTSNALDSNTKTEIQRLGATKAIILGGTGSISTSVESELKNAGITTIERIGGMNNYAVATGIASRVITSETDTVIFASGQNFADAIAASSYAGITQTPILITPNTSLASEVKTFLQNNPNINHIIISGGSLSSTVENELKNYGTVERVNGADRFELAFWFASEFSASPSFSAVADGTNYQHALAGAALAARNGGSVLLVTPTSLPNITLAYYEKYSPDLDNIYILGNTTSVSDSTASTLNKYIP
ncbi:cell wall-binding repeat-containing protein [Laceyella tengchongensis]|uniref:cell wall-binding repeat-containing protein n=1 Tax=Laceyella tengchongensis TaxID=574699 RepID=UPI0012B93577|nr:hypothetical protein [Laceyella tengchongensis]